MLGVMKMSKYTITIKNLIDNNFDFQMTSYPIFDENYRNTLNQNILNHYYEDEIGFETAPLFRHYLNQTLNEIMPKYNVLYLAQKEILDKNLLMSNVNLTENLDGSNTTETQNQSSSESNGKNLFHQAEKIFHQSKSPVLSFLSQSSMVVFTAFIFSEFIFCLCSCVPAVSIRPKVKRDI